MSDAVRRFKVGDRVAWSRAEYPGDKLPLRLRECLSNGVEGVVERVLIAHEYGTDYQVRWDSGPVGLTCMYDIELRSAGPIDYATQDEGGVV